MISEKFGHVLDRPLGPIVRHLRVDPNLVTLAGFLVTVTAAVCIPVSITAGGVLILVGGLLDAVDGVVARVHGTTTRFGAFLDSLLDRFSDAFIFLAIGVYFHRMGDDRMTLVAMMALIGSFGVSYARARAEGLGHAATVGIMERTERVFVIAVGCLFPFLLVPAVWVILVGTYYTVVQRVLHVMHSMSTGK